ncbi:MAG: ADP-forming succinate--CoA ligase subunit beta [Deltaproteobacteria bacterium]|nr:ADP-forming succinate--CoA ligase subunit beta [Deltaproteobacteria bacterium]MCZ6564379.1 ADP-forming succinate--CoA ligase subunit beta [Deltaproteobacteria bacterium]
MNVHEYQAKEILARYGVSVPKGRVASTPEEVWTVARELGAPCVIKAQIHAGGRGKAGGIKLAQTPEEAKALAQEIIGKKLVTHQTGPTGRVVKRVLVEQQFDIEHEWYLGVALDTSASLPSVMACAEGGVEIEEVARKSPEKIMREVIDTPDGLLPFQVRRLAYGLGLPYEKGALFFPLIQGLVRGFIDCDCMLAEINPLVFTSQGELVALDAKMNFDSNALFRHPEIVALRDTDEEDQKEIQASKIGLSYIALEGNIGCMVNGAGLAMATMDIIKLCGGEPANFLDVGGGASKDKVAQAFKIVLSDQRVQGVLVNIFGGIMRCDVIAEGIVEAAREMKITVPLVVRLQGTNGELGKKLLSESNLRVISADTMAEAAEKIVKAVNQF